MVSTSATPLEIERKFLLKGFNRSIFTGAGIEFLESHIEQLYLIPPANEPGTVLRVRKRTQDDVATYWRTSKKCIGSGTNEEIENEITASEYESSKQNREPSTAPIVKKRLCFTYEGQFFELDIFEGYHQGLCVLEIELSSRDQEVTLPTFLEIDREVTDEKGFSNRNLAQITA